AHLQYLGRDEREWFADELRRLRGLHGALVNENGLSQGEAEDLQRLNARQAREELRERVTQIDMPLSREERHIIWPELIEEHWHRLRARKQADEPNLGRGMFRPSWVSGVVASGHPNLVLGEYAHRGYEDVYDDRRRLVSYEALRDSVLAADGQRERVCAFCTLVRAIKLRDRWHAHGTATMCPVPRPVSAGTSLPPAASHDVGGDFHMQPTRRPGRRLPSPARQ